MFLHGIDIPNMVLEHLFWNFFRGLSNIFFKKNFDSYYCLFYSIKSYQQFFLGLSLAIAPARGHFYVFCCCVLLFLSSHSQHVHHAEYVRCPQHLRCAQGDLSATPDDGCAWRDTYTFHYDH